jgi:hypothetical protein
MNRKESAMKAVEFASRLDANDRIEIPPEVANQLPAGSDIRVIVLWDSNEDEDEAWRLAGMQSFAAAYAPEDSIYDELLHEPPPR